MSRVGPDDSVAPLTRLVYTSSRTDDGLSNEQRTQMVLSIVAQSRLNNARTDITGALLHTVDRFAQVLEGPADNVTALYERIAADDRHERLRLVAVETIEARSFGTWAMAYVGDDSDAAAAFAASSDEPDEDGLIGSDQVVQLLAAHLQVNGDTPAGSD